MTIMPIEPGEFSNMSEFLDFQALLKSSGDWEPVPVLHRFANVGEAETWFRCKSTNETWRLVEPDAPFRGVWEKVDASKP